MPNVVPQLVANGDIYPCRFVCLTGNFMVEQATDEANPLMGVSQEGSNQPPLSDLVSGDPKAAVSGQPVHVFTDGDVCLLQLGEAVSAGDLLTAGTGGKGVSVDWTGNAHFGAIALQNGGQDEKIMVQVRFGVAWPVLSSS